MYQLFSNVFDFSSVHRIEEIVKRYNRYELGWPDRPDKNHIVYMFGHLFKEDNDKMKFFSSIQNQDLLKKIKNRIPTKAVINVSFPGYFYHPHSHEGEESLIYYVNAEWNTDWSGETIIYDQNGKDIKACVPFSPGKVLWLDTGVVHAMRPPSLQAPFYRFTIAMFFKV